MMVYIDTRGLYPGGYVVSKRKVLRYIYMPTDIAALLSNGMLSRVISILIGVSYWSGPAPPVHDLTVWRVSISWEGAVELRDGDH